MPVEPELRTSRLILRSWGDTDRAPFAALNADPVVMEHFRAPLRGEESDALADRIAADIDERGWGLWAVDIPGTAAFAGFIGLNPATFDAPFTPAVEVG
jgi:RimJ/RimL family protein N-acetyltransferase